MKKDVNKILGEENINNFGSKMKIINVYKEYNKNFNRNYTFIDIYFIDYDWIFYKSKYENFKRGTIKCPYEPRVFGIGYIGEGKYKTKEKDNKQHTKIYSTWVQMLRRCYDKEFQKKNPTYKNCEVCEEWYNFQNFGKWYEENYYEIDGETMALDKDILVKGNKIYSPDTCMFVPERINSLFTKSDNNRGELPIGVRKQGDKFNSRCCYGKGKKINLGTFDNKHKAFLMYKINKELLIEIIANKYKLKIPLRLYNAMLNYKIEEND